MWFLGEKSRKYLKQWVEKGYANTLSEAVRLAIVDFGQRNLDETNLINRKLDSIDKEIKKGRRKLLDSKEGLENIQSI